jgi:PAS domain S-box-containing protein
MPQQILVVEDNPITRKLFRVTLQGSDYTVLEAPDGRTALDLADTNKDIDLVLLDLLLPDIHGVELMQQLRKLPHYDSKPILAVTGLLSKLEEARALNAGFTAYLLKPIEPSKLLETVATYLPSATPPAERPGRNRRVLLVDDDPVGLKFQKLLLQEAGFEVMAVDNAERALDIAKSSPPDAVVTDLVMPEVNGLELTVLMRKTAKLRKVPVIVTSSTYSVIDDRDVRTAREMGADNFVLRTPKLDYVIPALLEALEGKRKPRRVKAAVPLLRDFNRRLIHQLEIQAAQRTHELRRYALETAKLSVLAGVAEALNRELNLEMALMGALTRTLDVSGVSIGAIYLKEDDGRIGLKAHVGLSDEQAKQLLGLYGHSELLEQVCRDGKTFIVPSESIRRETVDDLLERGFARSLVLIPLVAGNQVQGVLLLASAARELVEDWLDLADAIGVQLAQAVLLSRTLTQVGESEQRFRELAENIKEIFFITGPNGSPVQYVSPAHEQITGQKAEALYKDPCAWTANIHPEDLPRMEKAIREGPDRLDEEYRIVRPDGDLRWLHARAFPVKDDTGKTLRIVGIAEDITRRKSAEGEAKGHLGRIRALHEIDSAIASSLDLKAILTVLLEKLDLFLPHDAATVRLYNAKTQQLDLVASRNVDEEEWKRHMSHGTHALGPTWRVFQTRKPLAVRRIEDNFRTQRSRFFVQQGLISFLGVPLVAKNEALGVLTLYGKEERDFTAEEIEFLSTIGGQAAIAIHNAQLYEKSQKQTEELEVSNRVKDEFLSVMSHELRTPLSVIMGYTGLVKDGLLGAINPQQADALKKVLGRAAEQLGMINDIMQTTQLDSRSLIIERYPVSVAGLMEQLRVDYQIQSSKSAVKLGWNYPEGPIEMTTDGAKLKQILQNIINNALKFTDEGSVTVSARVTGNGDQGSGIGADPRPPTPGPCFIEFTVADTGVGIPKDKLPTIFDKFFQVDSSATRLYGGVGLGLYIVKNFTDLLGGKIAVESESGKGATFTVRLPLDNETGADSSAAERERGAAE